jgi:hypothetical protein
MKKKARIDPRDLGGFEIHELDDGSLEEVSGSGTNISGCNNPIDCRDETNWFSCTNQRLCYAEVQQV